jgi:hypothetical protein
VILAALRIAAVIVLAAVGLACLVVSVFVVVFGTIAVTQHLSRGRADDADLTVVCVAVVLAVAAGLGVLVLRGLSLLTTREARAGFEVLPPR